MGVGTKMPVWVYSTEPAGLAAASPPITHKKGLGLPLHLPALPPPALPCGNASSLHCMEMLSERAGRWPGRSWSCAPEESTSWGDKSISQGGATALSGMSSYPLQGDKSHNEMTGHQPPPVRSISCPCKSCGTSQGCGGGSVHPLASSWQGLNKSCRE